LRAGDKAEPKDDPMTKPLRASMHSRGQPDSLRFNMNRKEPGTPGFIVFPSREPVSTSLENTLAPPRPLNSILATASTAHDLDKAHRKAAKAKVLLRRSLEMRPIATARKNHESLVQFVLRLGRLVAAQVKERARI
jgi:hypothetical protein